MDRHHSFGFFPFSTITRQENILKFIYRPKKKNPYTPKQPWFLPVIVLQFAANIGIIGIQVCYVLPLSSDFVQEDQSCFSALIYCFICISLQFVHYRRINCHCSCSKQEALKSALQAVDKISVLAKLRFKWVYDHFLCSSHRFCFFSNCFDLKFLWRLVELVQIPANEWHLVLGAPPPLLSFAVISGLRRELSPGRVAVFNLFHDKKWIFVQVVVLECLYSLKWFLVMLSF